MPSPLRTSAVAYRKNAVSTAPVPAILALADGTVFRGQAIGAPTGPMLIRSSVISAMSMPSLPALNYQRSMKMCSLPIQIPERAKSMK